MGLRSPNFRIYMTNPLGTKYILSGRCILSNIWIDFRKLRQLRIWEDFMLEKLKLTVLSEKRVLFFNVGDLFELQ